MNPFEGMTTQEFNEEYARLKRLGGRPELKWDDAKRNGLREMRDVIYNELMYTYAYGDVPPERSTYVAELNDMLAFDIAEYIQHGEEYRDFTMPCERDGIVKRIWMVWPGGSTAEIVADNIIKALELNL